MTRRTRDADRSPPPGRRHVRFDADARGERLVGIGFRCWLAGYDTGDISCWEAGWNRYAAELGTDRAKTAVAELGCWVRTLRDVSCRRLAYFPLGCAGFCRDECLAISMIAASQHDVCPALRACAYALIGAPPDTRVLAHAGDFAHAIADAGLHLDGPTAMHLPLLWDRHAGPAAH